MQNRDFGIKVLESLFRRQIGNPPADDKEKVKTCT